MAKQKISNKHNNRQPHNLLIYDISDKFLLKYTQYFKGQLVDLGCGEAHYKNFFLKYADSYIGVDWTKTLHDSKADIVSDLNQHIELPNEYANSLVSLSVMEHLNEPQIFLNECFRILKNGGCLTLQVPWQWWIHESPHDYFRYTPYGLRYLLEKAGFKQIEIEPSSGFFTMWFLKFNYFSKRFIMGPKLVRLIIKGLLAIIWKINHVTAPLLDKYLDKKWELETSGYYVVAFKMKDEGR